MIQRDRIDITEQRKKEGSITPTTLRKAFFEKNDPSNKAISISDKSSNNCPNDEYSNTNKFAWYIEEYEYGVIKHDNNNSDNGNIVRRYGINAQDIHVISNDNATTVLGHSTKIVKKEGSKSSQYKSEDVKKVIHHPLEEQLIMSAIEYIINDKKKTVLVDIFERELNNSGGALKVQDDHLINHTVVLCKKPYLSNNTEKYEVFVIDPSNFTYSSHISNLNKKIINKYNNSVKITTIHKAIKIYIAPSEKIGQKFDQFRDCTDIAVKLAFGFNNLKEFDIDFIEGKEDDTIKAIYAHKVIADISNQSTVDKAFPTFEGALSIRIKQTSDIEVVEKFNKALKVIDYSKQNVISLDKIKVSEKTTKFRTLLNTEKINGDILKDLLGFNEDLRQFYETHTSVVYNKIVSDHHKLTLLIDNISIESKELSGAISENNID